MLLSTNNDDDDNDNENYHLLLLLLFFQSVRKFCGVQLELKSSTLAAEINYMYYDQLN